jgi:hypothetical protein
MPTKKSIDWQIESIRATTFVNGQLNPDMLEAWLKEVSENSPSQINKKPSSFIGVSRSTAGFLRTSWNANRLDVILSSEEPQHSEPIASISELDSLFHRFVDRIREIGDLTLVDRIALGLTLTFQVSSESEGLEILSPIIKGLDISPSARDFLYRVNYPYKSSTVEGLSINRLAAWAVGHRQLIELQINQDGSQVQKNISQSSTVISLELDINTDQTSQLNADLDQLSKVLLELENIAVKVANDGESAMRD